MKGQFSIPLFGGKGRFKNFKIVFQPILAVFNLKKAVAAVNKQICVCLYYLPSSRPLWADLEVVSSGSSMHTCDYSERAARLNYMHCVWRGEING